MERAERMERISRAIFDALASTFVLWKYHIDEENEQAVEVVEYVLQNDFGIQDPIEVVSLYYHNYTSAKMDILVEFTREDGSVEAVRFRFDTRGSPVTPPIGMEFAESSSSGSDESDDSGSVSENDENDDENENDDHLQP